MRIFNFLVTVRSSSRIIRSFGSNTFKITDAANDLLFYKFINANETPKEMICFLIKQRDRHQKLESEKVELVLKAEKVELVLKAEKAELVLKAEKAELVLEAEREKHRMKDEINALNFKFKDLQRDVNSMTPRHIIGSLSRFLFMIIFQNILTSNANIVYLEYVEQYCLPNIKDLPSNFKTFNREEKWKAFLESRSGSSVLKCFLAKNPLWKDAKTTAKQICSIYQYSSNFSHGTSHEIAADPKLPIVLDELSTNVQTYAAMTCLMKHFGLSLINPDRIQTSKNETT